MTSKLDEKFVSDHEDSEIEDVEAEGGKVKKRLADKTSAITEADDKEDEAEDKEDLEEGKDDKDDEDKDNKSDSKDDEDDEDDEDDDEDLKEAFGSLFAGENLSEEFKSKLTTIFVASVNEAAHAKAAKLNDKYKASLSEEVKENMAQINNNLERYMDYVAESYIEENKLAIENGLKVELAESLLNSLKATFVEHNIAVDEEKLDLVEELEEEISSLKKDKNKVENTNISLAEENRQLKAEKAFGQISEGLTDVERDRLAVLSEKLSTKDLEVYKTDLGVLKESFFKQAPAAATEEIDVLVEETTNPAVKIEDESVAAIMNALNAIKRK